MDAVLSLQPSYIDKGIIIVGDDVDNAEISWGDATPISKEDIQTELDRIQALEDNCYEPRRMAYPPMNEQLDKIYHEGLDAWKADIKAVKDKYPKE